MTFDELERLVRPVGTGQTYKYGNVASTIGGGMNDHYLDINNAPLEIQYQAQKNMRGGTSPGGLITDYSGSNFTMGTGRIQHNYGDARIIEEQKAGREGEDVRSSYEIAAQLALLRRSGGGGGDGSGRIVGPTNSKDLLPLDDLTPDERLQAMANEGGHQLPQTKDEQLRQAAIVKAAYDAREKERVKRADFYNEKRRKGEIKRAANGELMMLQDKEVVDSTDPTKINTVKQFMPFNAVQKSEYLQGVDRGLISKEPEGSWTPPPAPAPPPIGHIASYLNAAITEIPRTADYMKTAVGNYAGDAFNGIASAANLVAKPFSWLSQQMGAPAIPKVPLMNPYIPNDGGQYLSDEEIARRMQKINVGNIWTGGVTNRSPF